MRTNFLGTVYGCQAALKHMRPRNEGIILNVSSIVGHRPMPRGSRARRSRPRSRAAWIGLSATGENIGVGFTTAAAIVQGWMTSTSGHCDILMSTRTLVGIGYDDTNGRRTWTADLR